MSDLVSVKPSYEVPGEVLEHILSYVVSTDTYTLSTLLRVSKLLCRITVARLYTNAVVTPNSNLLLDTNLSSELLDGVLEGQETDGRKDASSSTSTLKRSFLALTRTVDIYPPRPTQISTTENSVESPASNLPGMFEALLHDTEPVATSPIPSIPPPAIIFPTPTPCSQLRLRLDTSSHRRLSPYSRFSDLWVPDGTAGSLWEALRPRRLVLHGAGFHQDSSPIADLSLSHFDTLEEIIVVITPGAMPGDSDMLSMNHGLPFILDCLIRALDSACFDINVLQALSVNITFILQTPRPGIRFPPIDPKPHGSMAMTMDYHPDYAPGYLHALTTSLSQRMVVMRTLGSEERKARVGSVTFVNFGMLEGDQVGMPQAAEEEMQERFEKGLRVRLRRAGVSTEYQGLEVMGMREWLKADKGKAEEILDEDILRGWR